MSKYNLEILAKYKSEQGSKQICITIPREILKEIEELTTELTMNRSQVITLVLREGLKNISN